MVDCRGYQLTGYVCVHFQAISWLLQVVVDNYFSSAFNERLILSRVRTENNTTHLTRRALGVYWHIAMVTM